MPMKRVLGGLGRWTWYLAAMAVVLSAALVSLGQYYFPYLDDYREEIVARLANELPFGIELAGLRAEWTGLSPTFHVTGLRLYARDDPGATILLAPRGDISIDLVRSAFARAPRLRRISAEQVRVAFREDANGGWHIAGLGSARSPANPDEVLAFFLAIEEVALRQAQLELYPAAGGSVVTQDAELFLENYRSFRRLRVSSRNVDSPGRLDLLVEATGDPRTSGGFEARAHATLQQVSLARLQPLFGARPLPQGETSGELWASFGGSGHLWVQGGLSAPVLALPGLASGRQLGEIENLDLQFAADWSVDRSSVWIERARGRWFGQDLALDRMHLESSRQGDGWRHVFGAEYLELGSLSTVALASGVLPEPWRGILDDLAPYGGLTDTHLDLKLHAAAPAEVQVRARLEDVSASPWKDAPGVRNVRGLLSADAHGGHVDIDSGAVTLEFPRLYREDLDFDSLRGRVSWQIDEQGLVVGAERLQLVEADGSYDALFRLRLNRDPQLEDEFSLAVGFHKLAIDLHHRFVPYVVSGELRQWLDGALRGGEAGNGMFALRAAFGRQDGAHPLALQLLMDVDGGVVAYHPDWPGVDGVRARLLLDEKKVTVWANAGQVYDSHIDEALVGIDMSVKPARVTVNGRIFGDLADGLRVIETSPLATTTRGALRNWRGDGSLEVALDLDMPLGVALDAREARIEVGARLEGARLDIGWRGLQVDALRGRIDYSLERGLAAEDLQGTLWGRPLQARIGPGETGPASFAVQVDGSAAVPDLERWLGFSSGGALDGAAPFRLRITQEGGSAVSRIESDLSGVSSMLPAPLSKSASEPVPLAIAWWATPEGTAARAGLGDVANLALGFGRDGLARGEIVAGTGAPPQAGGETLRLRGDLPRADAGDWIVAVQRLIKANPIGGGGLEFRLDGLRVAEARLWSGILHDARLDSRWENGDFVLDFAADAAAGKYRAPADHAQPMVLHLERLDLSPFLPDEQPPAADAGVPAATPSPPPPPSRESPWNVLHGAQLPDFAVTIDSLRMGARDLGHWDLRLGSGPDELSLTEVKAEMPGASIAAIEGDAGASLRLRWQDGMPHSEIDARVQFSDIGAFFDNWGQTRVLESRTGRVNLALRWPGGPSEFALAASEGSMALRFRDGRLLNESSNNPLMRAIGLLRFDELLRRMKFDFKDFYQSGLVFDKFDAPIAMGGGVARTDKSVELEGPAARIRLEGRSDLRAQQIDASMIVTLPIGSNLPWVAALAGGLPVAAGVFVASRLFEQQIGKLSSAVYKVSGPLDDPKVEFQNVFDVETPAGQASPGEKRPKSP